MRARFAMQRSRLAERVDRPDLRCCFIRRRGPGVGGPSQGCFATRQLSSRCTAQVLWALDVRTGAAVLPPAVIGGVGYSGGQAFTFTANIQNNRLGLAFDGTNLYLGFGSHCDYYSYQARQCPGTGQRGQARACVHTAQLAAQCLEAARVVQTEVVHADNQDNAYPAALRDDQDNHASAACRAQGWLFAYNAATLQQVGAHAARSACSP